MRRIRKFEGPRRALATGMVLLLAMILPLALHADKKKKG